MSKKPKVEGVNRSKHYLYGTWADMRKRCYKKESKSYANYGGRGIKICERWSDFANFVADMGKRPEGMSMDRIDNNGDYTPENCRWADAKTQNGNTRAVARSCGYPGISLSASGRYRARQKSQGVETHLGTFDTLDEAKSAIELYNLDKVKRSETRGINGVSKTGFKNVYYDTEKKYFYVQYTINKIRYCRNGTFKTAEEANEYVKRAKAEKNTRA